MASPPSQVEGVQGPETTCEPAKGPDPPSPPSASPPDEEEPTLPEGFGKSFAVRDGERQGVYIYVPTEGLTPQQILILEAEVVRAATTQAQRNKELQHESQDLLEPRKERSDPLPSTSGSLPGPIPNWDQLKRQQQGVPLGKPEHTPRRRGRRGGVKQHLYQQMHAQQRSLRNASAMHQNALMSPHLEGLPQAALNPAGLMTGGTGVFLPAQQASRRRSLPVGGLPSALPGAYMPGAQQLNYLQGSAPAFNNAGNPLLHAPGAVQPGAPFGGHLDAGGGSEYLIGQSDQARLMASVSNSPGGNTELVTDALSRMLTSWAPLDMRMASDSISSNNSADTIRQMSMEQARNSSLLTSSGDRPHARQLSAHMPMPMDVSGFWANAANPGHPMDLPRQ